MNPLTAYALGILTACGLSLLALGLLAYYDHREALKKRVERRGTYTPPDPPSPDHLVVDERETGSFRAVESTLGQSTHIKPMSIRELEDAEEERNIRWLLDNYPVDRERHLYAVDTPTAQILNIPTTAGPDAA